MTDLGNLAVADPLATVDIRALSESPVFDELFDDIVSGKLSPAGGDGPSNSWSANPLKNPRRRWPVLVAAAAAVLIVCVVGVEVVGSGPNHEPGQTVTPWEAAQALPSPGALPKNAAAHGWELVGDIVPAGWRLRTAGPGPGALSCATTTTCYVLGDTASSPMGPARYGALYRSSNFGTSWSMLPLPAGLSAPTPLSCPSALSCSFGALFHGQAALLATTDGGHQWTITPVAGGGQFTALTCFSNGTCDGLIVAHATGALSEGHNGVYEQAAIFVRTTDSGLRWSRHRLQPSQVEANMACPSSGDCVVRGNSHSYLSAPQLVERTTDGGRTWSSGQLPQGFTPEFGITCSSPSDCILPGQTPIPGKTPCITDSSGIKNLKTCTFGPSTRGSVATTDDGGVTWRIDPFPTEAENVSAATCASATVCWATGQAFSAGTSAVLWGTDDGGANWTRTAFTIPRGAPEDIGHDTYDEIGRISCPSTTACLALGVVDQGSASTPVYSFKGSS